MPLADTYKVDKEAASCAQVYQVLQTLNFLSQQLLTSDELCKANNYEWRFACGSRNLSSYVDAKLKFGYQRYNQGLL